MAKLYYEKDADLAWSGREGGDHRLRLAGPRPRAEPAGLRRRRAGRPAGGVVLEGQGGGGGPAGRSRVAEAVGEADIVMVLLPDTEQAAVYEAEIAPEPRATGDALFFAHGFNIHFGQIVPPAGVDVVDGRPEGPGSPRAPHLHRGRRRAVAHRRAPGRHRQGEGHRARPTRRASAAPAPACSRPPSRRRPRPTSSASRSCSAVGSPRSSGRLRDAGRGRLPARVGVLRVPARAEAHRRPHVRGGHRGHALLDLRHRRVRRHDAWAADHRRAGPAARCGRSSARSRDGSFAERMGGGETARAGRGSTSCAPPEGPTCRVRRC